MKKVFLLSLALLPLAACGNITPPPPELNATLESPALEGNAVPLAVNEALALTAVLGDQPKSATIGAQAVANLQFSSETVNDLDGVPFYRLTVSSKGRTAADFLSAVKAASVLPAPETQVYGTGASIDRGLYAFQFDGDFTRSLQQTLEAAGSFAGLVSPQGNIMYLKDKQGRFWDVMTAKMVPDAQLKRDRATYQSLKASYVGDPKLVKDTRDVWTKLTSNGKVGTASLSTSSLSTQSLAAFTNADGSLNIPAYLTGAKAAAGLKATSYGDDFHHCEGWFCGITVRFSIAGISNSETTSFIEIVNNSPTWSVYRFYDFGNMQRAEQEPYFQALGPGQSWGMRYANPFVGGYFQSSQGQVIGCAGTAFARTMNIMTNLDTNFSESLKLAMKAAYPTSTLDARTQMLKDLSQPVQADNTPAGTVEPRITQMMGGGRFINGTLVTPDGIRSGIATWLAYRGMPYHVEGETFFKLAGEVGNWLAAPSLAISSDFNAFTWRTRDVVQRAINNQASPVIYAYATAPGTQNGYAGHYAPSTAYKTYENWMYADVLVYNSDKERFVGPTGWINITNRWSTFGGAHAIIRN